MRLRLTLGAALLLVLAALDGVRAGEAVGDSVAEVRALFGRGDYAAASAAGLPLAGQGNAEVQYMVGFALLHGAGGERDVQQALRWLRASAEGGDPRGQAALGHCYGRGLGVRADPVRAYMWYTIAVESGTAEAAEPQALQAAKLTPAQVRQGRRQAREWLKRHGQ